MFSKKFGKPERKKHGGEYFLLYSANEFMTDAYAIGYATCESPTGPCHKPRRSPLLASKGPVRGPGAGKVFATGEGRTLISYHAWAAPEVGYPEGRRGLYLEVVSFGADGPVVHGPTWR